MSAIHVQWSEPEAAYVARSDEHPGVVNVDRWSSLAAVNGLLDKIQGAWGETGQHLLR